MSSKVIPNARDLRKIVVALQFWEGDKARAMRLARFIADLEPGMSDKVEFAFVARFDATHDHETIAYVSHKFKVWTLTGTRRTEGWPDGCNDLALDLFHQAARLSRPRNSWENIKAVYLIESDVMPVCKDWLARISDEWDVAQEHGKFILGSWSPYHSPVGHVNGNMLVAPDLVFRLSDIISCPFRAGWDAHFGPKFSPHWWKSVLLQNHYDYRANIPPEILWSGVDGVTPPAVVHGVKDNSAERQVREKLGA